MGNTCASIHIAWRGAVDDAAKAISRGYNRLGYERVKKAPTEGYKHAVLLARTGQNYVSVYDSDNARLDNGELKDLALAVSKALKTAAVFTSLYDSDTYEFIVFANGRQIDLLMTDAENYEGSLKKLSDRTRSSRWSRLFGRTLSTDQIERAATRQTVFADDIVAGLSELIGLSEGQSQINYEDFFNGQAQVTAELHFRKKPKVLSDILADEIRLSDYFDPDNCRMRAVYPSSWPIPIGSQRLATWLILSQGAGFSGGTSTFRISGPDTLVPSKGIIGGCKFHNGQIVGPLEPVARNLTKEDVAELLEAKTFRFSQAESSSSEWRIYRGEFPNLVLPSMTPERTTQILVILQIELEPRRAGEWKIEISIRPGMQTDYQHNLPPVRIAAVEQAWLPVVSGLNPRIVYNKSNLSATHIRELDHTQSQVLARRQLDYPAVTSTVAILKDEGQSTLDVCRSWLEEWLHPLAAREDGEIRIHGEKHVSEAFHVGKTRKTAPVSDFLSDKTWRTLFDYARDYQTVLVSFAPEGAECPVAGIGLQHSLKRHGQTEKEDYDTQTADTLSAMRGRPFDRLVFGSTWHVSKWVINHQDCYEYLRTSIDDMERQLDAFAGEQSPLQAWSSGCTWIPAFDQADEYRRTVYEEASVLNWFRGIFTNGNGLNDGKMTTQWCANVLRMVTPRLWLSRSLIDQVDREMLERVAQVSEARGVYRVVLREGRALDELELALLPILPVESARIAVVGNLDL